MAAGNVLYGGGVAPTKPPLPTTQFGNPSTFTAAANQQASDYDKIMAGYDNLIASTQANPVTAGTASSGQVSAPERINPSQVNFGSVTPQTSRYQQSGDVTSSLAGLSDLATTGGYTPQGIADIRERDISPIRSIYANARQNTERTKALGGGYSPNFNATTAQMARDEAGQIGGITTAANAGIAQNVASNRIAAAPAYASASANANAAQTEADKHNADIVNQINQYNSQGRAAVDANNAANSLGAQQFNSSALTGVNTGNVNRAVGTSQFNVQSALDAAKANQGTISSALAGKTNLYGTTPALTNTFGNQVTQAAQLGQNQQQINTQRLNQGYSAINGLMH